MTVRTAAGEVLRDGVELAFHRTGDGGVVSLGFEFRGLPLDLVDPSVVFFVDGDNRLSWVEAPLQLVCGGDTTTATGTMEIPASFVPTDGKRAWVDLSIVAHSALPYQSALPAGEEIWLRAVAEVTWREIAGG